MRNLSYENLFYTSTSHFPIFKNIFGIEFAVIWVAFTFDIQLVAIVLPISP